MADGEQRVEFHDRLYDALPTDMVIWDDDEELDAFPWTLARWMDVLGHKRKHTACCQICGCATTCMAGAFYQAVASSVIRELDRIGALREPPPPALDQPQEPTR